MTDETREPVTVWDAFECEKRRRCAYCGDAARHMYMLDRLWQCDRCAMINDRQVPDIAELIALIEQHPTAQAGALLEAWRKRKTQPPDKRAG